MNGKNNNIFFKIWYWYISTIDKNGKVIFTNYGYSKNNDKVLLNEEDETYRYSIQLYSHVTKDVDLSGKNILEVECGRGGGLSYINRYLLPFKVTGIDLNMKSIRFCKKNYTGKNNLFLKANPQKLPFVDNKYDVIINIESSHRYSRVDLFINEMHRVLKEDGYFLFTDYGKPDKLKILEERMNEAGFRFIKKENITPQVIEALTLSSREKKELIDIITPVFLRALSYRFAVAIETPTYNNFINRHYEYVFYVLKK